MQKHFTIDDVFASPTPKPFRHPDGGSIGVTEYLLAGGQAARVRWSRWYGPSIGLNIKLSVVDKLRALRWAAQTLERHILIDPSQDFIADLDSVMDLVHIPAQRISAPAVVAPDEVNDPAWGVRKVECRDCPSAFDPDSSPHPDRCWSCAERVDGVFL